MEAVDGLEALDIIKKEKIDLVLMDMKMPKLDGYETTKIMKNSEIMKHIPIVALTASAMKEDRDAFMDAGCDDYISKPIDHKLILKKLNEWL